MTSKVVYSGNLRTELVHIKSGDVVITDAPLDNNGKGEAFSPTDLLATSLAACMLTVIGIKAESLSIDIKGSSANVTKHMTVNPRRVQTIDIQLYIKGATTDVKAVIEHTAKNCPVAKSLNKDVIQNIEFIYL